MTTNKEQLTHGLVWFDQDLRVDDNPALYSAAAECDRLVFAYCVDPDWWQARHWQCRRVSEQRARFIQEGLEQLRRALQERGAALMVVDGAPTETLSRIIETFSITRLYTTTTGSVFQHRVSSALQERHPAIGVFRFDGDHLFEQSNLPFALQDLPVTFTAFRKQVENIEVARPVIAPKRLPPPLHGDQDSHLLATTEQSLQTSPFHGGCQVAKEHLAWYFGRDLAHQYKATRNALDGWENSTKFSPWLAQGAVSARQIVAALREYEQQHGSSESTYWIYFELLWREYFKWYARCHGAKLFRFSGLRGQAPLTSFYPERFTAWCAGNTPYPLVNACMRQLNATGYMSNRGRQIVASCLVNELQLDWRYGAAYFEQQLLDYDVASNWGNWQYIAGVGADPRGGRHFNLEKQAAQYDSEGRFVRRWKAEQANAVLDSRDAADWPISGTSSS